MLQGYGLTNGADEHTKGNLLDSNLLSAKPLKISYII